MIRGIPPGYIAGLEQRLLETEIALFDILSSSRIPFHQDSLQADPTYYDGFTEYNTTQSKEAKVEEWKRLPLKAWTQRQAWLEEKSRMTMRGGIRRESVAESPVLQEADRQWMGSPPLGPSGENTTQQVPKEISPIYGQNSHDAEEITRDEYGTTMNEERVLENGQDSQPEPRILLDDNHWWNRSSPPQVADKTKSLPGKEVGTYDSNVLVNNSNLLVDQHLPTTQAASGQDLMSAAIVPTTSQHQRNSISGGMNGHPRDARQISSTEWKTYF